MTALTAMDKLLFWLGLGAAQKGARSKEAKPSRLPRFHRMAAYTRCPPPHVGSRARQFAADLANSKVDVIFSAPGTPTAIAIPRFQQVT
jgi:hypothetical protein